MTNNKQDKTELGALFYPTVDQSGNKIPFESLFIPYIYREIEFEGVYIDILNGHKETKDLTIVDVGANIGVTVDHFKDYAKTVYAIEPSPEHFAALKKNKEFNKWDNVVISNIALADKNGEMEFRQSPNNRTTNQLVQKGHLHNSSWYNEEILKVKTMDMETYFKEHNIDHVDFMKFDPEGAEELILYSEAFRKVADKISAIECEFHHADWPNIVDYLGKLGYSAKRYDSSAIIVLFTR
jgi:FkbM family methyltransferase